MITTEQIQTYPFWPWPEEDEGVTVQFRLVYRGRLPAQGGGKGGTRLGEKHAIRKYLHPQLKELWNQHDFLRIKITGEVPAEGEILLPGMPEATLLANRFVEGKFRFLPLITKSNGLACKLDILFLRRDAPGNLIENGGDIDNRIKVLFDALKVPDRGSMMGFSPESGEDPLFCLLEDDRLITEVSVVTDRLLVPVQDKEHIHDVVLVLSIIAKVIDARVAEFGFLG
jgi:hypothetical protein